MGKGQAEKKISPKECKFSITEGTMKGLKMVSDGQSLYGFLLEMRRELGKAYTETANSLRVALGSELHAVQNQHQSTQTASRKAQPLCHHT